MLSTINNKVDILFSAHDVVIRKTFIRYAQNQNTEKPNNLKSLDARKSKA